MVILDGEPFEFTANEEGDQLVTSRVILDDGLPPVSLAIRWQPVMESWLASVVTSSGKPLVTDRPLRHQGDVLGNIVTQGRPRGSIVMITRDGLSPTRETWTNGGVLYYFRDGLEAILA